MNISLLKIASALSALIVFMPTPTGILLPFGLALAGYENYSGWQAFLLATIIWISLLYLVYSALKGFKSRRDGILTFIPLVSFWLFLATHVMDFINYANWLSLTTGILSAIVIAITILALIKRLKSSQKQTTFRRL